MVRYYYDRHNSTPVYTDNAPWVTYNDSVSLRFGDLLYKGFLFDSTTNTYSTTGGLWSGNIELRMGDVGYKVEGNVLSRTVAKDYVAKAQTSVLSSLSNKDPANNPLSYTPGTLVVANIIAEDGAYPANGRAADGYWYVRKGVVNTAPSIPGAFASPVVGTVLKGGSVAVLDWYASTDADGDGLTYFSEYNYHIAGVWQGWMAVGNSPGGGHQLTISTNKSVGMVQFRVRANDGKEYSPYRESQGYAVNHNTAPSTPGEFTGPAGQTLMVGDTKTVSWGASWDAEGNLMQYVLEAAIGSAGWGVIGQPTASASFTYLIPDTHAITFRVKALDTEGLESAYRQSGTYTVNTKPTVTLNTANNLTLYENDTFKIDGSALDPNAGDILNVYYRINGGTSRAIATGISSGAAIPFNEQLTFKGGVLYKGATAVTGALAEGPAHRLEVWSQDNQGGQSTVAERTFYAVPNRPPALTVNPFTEQSGAINNDVITLSGTSSDPDGNDVTVKYRVNEHAAVQIHSGVAGPWSFDLQLKNLRDGENIIVVEVTDTYGFKSSKTIKLNKHANLSPLTQSVHRFQIVPPRGSAVVIIWVQRDPSLTVSADISMTSGSVQEKYLPMTLNTTAPVFGNMVEDEFVIQAANPQSKIFVKLTLDGPGVITLISGVLM